MYIFNLPLTKLSETEASDNNGEFGDGRPLENVKAEPYHGALELKLFWLSCLLIKTEFLSFNKSSAAFSTLNFERKWKDHTKRRDKTRRFTRPIRKYMQSPYVDLVSSVNVSENFP